MATIQQSPIPAHELVTEPGELPRLRSNYGKYIDPESTGWLKPTSIDFPLDEMRKRIDEDGYVYVKNVIPREVVLDMRQQ
jgi:phytanoyl-CoA hydroxylase